MGRSHRLIIALKQRRDQFVGLYRRYPRGAFLVSGVAAVYVAVLIALVAVASPGSSSGSDVLADNSTATPDSTLTPTATATIDPAAIAEWAAALATPTPGPAGGSSSSQGPAASSGMRMKIPSIGVDAPVNIRVMGTDGVMGVPNGKDDVVWYDFTAWPGMGGSPGSGGNAVFAGHVDYHPNYEAVFWNLHLVGPGDIIEVDLADGTPILYSVQWSKQIGDDDDFSTYVAKTGQDIITIVTCQGTFNPATHNYDHRLVVRGLRVN